MKGRWFEPSFKDIRLSARHLAILELFNYFKILRSNHITAFFPNAGWGHGVLDDLNVLYDGGYLGRFVFNGTNRIVDGRSVKINNNEMFSYYRLPKGDKIVRNSPKMNHHANEERALIDRVRASMLLGARRDGRTLEMWHDIVQNPKTPEQEGDGTKPFRFYIKEPDKSRKNDRGEYLTFDGEPCRVFAPDSHKSIALFMEMDLHTEQIEYSETSSSLGYKFTHYKNAVWKTKAYTQKYGFQSAFLQVVTINERHLANIEKWIANNLGPTQWILLATIDDHTQLGQETPVTTKYWDEPYRRVGYAPFSLKTMSEA